MIKANQLDDGAGYNAQWVETHYDEYGAREWERLVQTPVDEVSLHVHATYLTQYVSAGAQALEVGAGPGRFTQVLAEIEARIVVADISPVQLRLNRQHAQEFGFAHAVESWHRLDMCDMTDFASGRFDFVVAYGGPLSYVMNQRDRALAECMRVLKPGGMLLLSVMSMWGSARRHLCGVLAIPAEVNRQITDSGDLSAQTVGETGHFCHMFRARELRHWLTEAGLEVVAMSAANCLSVGKAEELLGIREDEAKRGELLRMEREAGAEEGCLDMGTHLIAVARKP